MQYKSNSNHNIETAELDSWDPQLEGPWNMRIGDVLVDGNQVYVAGGTIKTSSESEKGYLLDLDKETAAVNKMYTAGTLSVPPG